MTIRNQYLFAQAYLDQVMADPSHDGAAATLGQGLADWAPFRDDESLSTLTGSWVGPVLDILGFHHQALQNEPGLRRLYADITSQDPLGVCLIVPPRADPDSTIKGSHYAFQIVAALREQGCTWGMMTDGSRWRLVNAEVIRPYESYSEVDFGQVKARPSADSLRVFHAFFRRDAFVADEDNKTLLDEHLARSEDVAECVQDHLRDNMESVLGALCRGFVMADGRQSHTEEQRAEIFDNATYLLYRILFILYAEARGLLPVGKPAYDEIGMEKLVKHAVRYHEEGVPEQSATTLWDGLQRLSKAIYESDEDRGVPAYNGGLFSDEDTEDLSKGYLRDCSISDPHLASALFDLTHMPNSKTPHRYQTIDYRDLSVRALGGLYEGMLEYKLFLAQEKTYGVPDGKGGYEYELASKVKKPKRTYRVIEAGDVYFSHSPTQRRATGSYYTHEYIVDYIVRQTVHQGVRERRKPLEAKLTDWLDEVHGALDDAERTRLQKAVDREVFEFVEDEVLTFRVCDPAMGSGHFLVNTAHAIANFIVETLSLTAWENAQIDSDPQYWRRRVVESCIYGVDLNPLAVELAKLSLWLASVAKGKPLSFLDHHMREGNSLIGVPLVDLAAVLSPAPLGAASRREQKQRDAGQLSMLDDPAFMGQMTLAASLTEDIATHVAGTLDQVKAQAADYAQARERLAPYRLLADLLAALHFGLKLDQQELPMIAKYVISRGSTEVSVYDDTLATVDRIALEQRFFHWALEFPELFLKTREGLSGWRFDVMVTNPPYSAQMSEAERRWIGRTYETGHGYKNSALHFTELCVRQAERAGLIVPKSITFVSSWRAGRTLLSQRALNKVVDVGMAFEDVLLEQVILVTDASQQSGEFESIVWGDRGPESAVTVPHDLTREADLIPCGITGRELDLFTKVNASGRRLAEVCSAFEGLHWYDRLRESGDTPVFRGGHIRRYELSPPQEFVELSESDLDRIEIRRLLGPKVLLQRIVAHITRPRPHILIQAFADDSGSLVLKTVEVVLLDDGVLSPHGLTALLNSRLMAWYAYRFIFNKAVRSMDFDRPYVDKIPLPSLSPCTPSHARGSILAKVKVMYEDQVASHDLLSNTSVAASPLITFVSELLSAEPKKPDVVHDLLAYLAERMIEMNKGKHTEAREFLDWLAGCTQVSIRDWRLKTYLDSYWEHGWDELHRALNQNRKAIEKASGYNVENPNTLATIQAKWSRSIAQLAPLLQRIATTDRLIDLIVYQLYGLNEEDVAIVESTT